MIQRSGDHFARRIHRQLQNYVSWKPGPEAVINDTFLSHRLGEMIIVLLFLHLVYWVTCRKYAENVQISLLEQDSQLNIGIHL